MYCTWESIETDDDNDDDDNDDDDDDNNGHTLNLPERQVNFGNTTQD
jgi:hypothetical protein